MQPITQDNEQVLEPLARMADEILLMRQARRNHLPGDLLGEPVWDIFLSLYRKGGSVPSIAELCEWSGVPESATKRWVALLEQRGFLSHSQATGELSLTHEGRGALERTLEAILLAARR